MAICEHQEYEAEGNAIPLNVQFSEILWPVLRIKVLEPLSSPSSLDQNLLSIA